MEMVGLLLLLLLPLADSIAQTRDPTVSVGIATTPAREATLVAASRATWLTPPAALHAVVDATNTTDYRRKWIALIDLMNRTARADWFFIADDDTVLSWRRARAVLARVDHTLPYVLGRADAYVDGNFRPMAKCVPSTYEAGPTRCCSDTRHPCRYSAPVAWDRGGDHFWYDLPIGPSPSPQPPPSNHPARPFGGAGVAISAGLLDAVPRAAWMSCMGKPPVSGLDVLLGMCLGSSARVGITNVPGFGAMSLTRVGDGRVVPSAWPAQGRGWNNGLVEPPSLLDSADELTLSDNCTAPSMLTFHLRWRQTVHDAAKALQKPKDSREVQDRAAAAARSSMAGLTALDGRSPCAAV